MKNQIKTLMTLIILTAILSCDKKPDTYITGTVVEYGTHTPIPGAKLSFIAGNSNGILVPDDEWWLDTVRTDANGKYEFGTDEDADYFYIGNVTKDGFYTESDPEFYFYKGNDESFEIVLDPYAWLEIEAINVDTIEADAVSFRASYTQQYNPTVDYTKIIDDVEGNRYIYIYIKTNVFGKPDPPNITDSIYVAAQDTAFYQILY